MEPMLLLCVVASLLFCITNQASLRVEPEQAVFLKRGTVKLSCEEAGWMVKRNTSRSSQSHCDDWGSWKPPTCTIRGLTELDTGLYWCEGPKGQRSDTFCITVTDKPHQPSASRQCPNKTKPQTAPPAASTAPPAASTTPPTSLTTPPTAVTILLEALTSRSPVVALVCHLLVLCPYIICTGLMLSL